MEEKTLEQRIYSYHPQKTIDLYEMNCHSDMHPGVNEVENGIILPCVSQGNGTYLGGVCDENFKFCGGFFTHKGISGPQKWVYDSYEVPEEELSFVDEEVVFGGVLQNHPGHLIRDSFGARMWWYVKNPDSKLKVAVLLMWEDAIWWKNDFIKEFVELMGIPEERLLIVRKPTKFRKVIVPEQSLYVAYPSEYTDEYVSVIKALSANVEPAKYEKIYFTKSLTTKKDVVNEKYFIDFFENKGFEIINPEDLSMREKISVLKGAKEFATLSGTNSLFAIFCDPSVRLIILERNYDTQTYQPFMNEVAGIKDFYSVNISLNFLSDNYVWGTKLIGITDDWKRFVKDIYGEEITETTEDVLKEFSYEYLKAFAEYTAQPQIFDVFKRSDHFTILNTMNKLFLDRTLDPKDYNIERLQDYRRQITSYKDQISTSREVNVRQSEILAKLLFGTLERLDSGMNMKTSKRKKVLSSLIRPTFTYRVNCGDKWTVKVHDEEIAGSDGSKEPIVSFRIDPEENTPRMYYSVFTSEDGWTPDVHEGQSAGSVRKAQPVKGLRIHFDEAISELFSVRYRVFTHPRGWTAWVEDGVATPWRGCDLIDAVQIQVVQKEDYVEKANAVCDKFFADLGKAIDTGVQALKNREAKSKAAEISALENKIAAQEYVIKSLENTLAAIVSNKKDEG